MKRSHASARYGRRTQDSLYQRLSDDASKPAAMAAEMDRRSSTAASEDEVIQFYVEDAMRNIVDIALARAFEKWWPPLCCCTCIIGGVIESLDPEMSSLSHGR